MHLISSNSILQKAAGKKAGVNLIALLMVLLLVLGTVPAALAAEASTSASTLSDIQEHWAKTAISEFIASGLASGYPDGTFRPENQISRAEFISLANRVFSFDQEGQINFTDVSTEDWFATEVKKAVAAGYISGYPDGTFYPRSGVSRQEAATMMATIKGLDREDARSASNAFIDNDEIGDWARGAVNAVNSAQIMRGYPDQSFKPGKLLTRAESIILLKAASGTAIIAPISENARVFNKAGNYGPVSGIDTVEGDAIIEVSGVTLQNMLIKGNLLLAEGIGDGEVTLINVKVEGATSIKGGGPNSVTLENCQMPSIIVSKEGVRVVASGSTSVNIVKLENGATLVQTTTSGSGFETVTLSQVIPAGAGVNLVGDFNTVNVESAGSTITISGGTIANLQVGENAAGSTIDLSDDARIDELTLNAAASVTGTGEIGKATVNADGASFEQTPTSIENSDDYSYSTGSTNTSTGTGSGTGTGGGGGVAPLNLVSSDPADGETGVSSLPTIILTFDRGVVRDHWDTNQNCVSLKDESNQEVASTVYRAVNYLDDDEKEKIYLEPDAPLEAGESYTVVISSSLTANNDNTLGRQVTVSFTVAAGGGGGGGGGGDQSGATVVTNSNMTRQDNITLNVTDAKGSGGSDLNGSISVTVTSSLDGQMYSSNADFTNGSATITIPTTNSNTLGTHTLTVDIDGVTTSPTAEVSMANSSMTAANCTVGASPALGAGADSTVTVTLKDSGNRPLANTSKTQVIFISITDAGGVNESYTVKGTAYDAGTDLEIFNGAVSTDNSGSWTFAVNMPDSIDVDDGISIAVKQSNGTLLGTVSYTATDLSGATLASNSNMTRRDDITINVSDARDGEGTALDGLIGVTVTSNLDGQMYSGDVAFVNGSAAVTVPTGDTNTLGTHTLTVDIAGVTTAPTVDVTMANSSMAAANCTVSAAPALGVGVDSTVTVTLKDSGNRPLANTSKTQVLFITVTDAGGINESYTVKGTAYDAGTDLEIFNGAVSTDNSGSWTFAVNMPDSIDVDDGISIAVKQSNGTLLGTVSYTASDQSGATLASSSNMTRRDNINLEVSNAKDINGTSLDGSIAVTVTSNLDGQMYSGDVAFVTGSAAVAVPTGDTNTLGTHTLTVDITGVTTAQTVDVTMANSSMAAANCSVSAAPALGVGVDSTVTVTLKDSGNRPLANTSKTQVLFITVTDAGGINESYTVKGTAYDAGTDLEIFNGAVSTDNSGSWTFAVNMPDSIDVDDGISIAVKQSNGTLLGTVSYTAADQSGAALDTNSNMTRREDIDLDISNAQDFNGTSLDGSIAVTVTSNLDGQLYSGDVAFVNGSAAVAVPTGDTNTLGTHTLTVDIAGVTTSPTADVIMANSSMAAGNCSVTVDPVLGPGSSNTVTVTLRDSANRPLANTSKTQVIYITITDAGGVNESYTVKGTAYDAGTDLEIFNGAVSTDNSGSWTFEVEMPGIIDAGDGISITVKQSNGTLLGTVNYTA